jgi:hypothetical protein
VLGRIGEVAHVLKRDAVALDDRRAEHRDFWFPVSILTRLQGRPPDETAAKQIPAIAIPSPRFLTSKTQEFGKAPANAGTKKLQSAGGIVKVSGGAGEGVASLCASALVAHKLSPMTRCLVNVIIGIERVASECGGLRRSLPD